jgi:hypothetical protein
MTFLETALQCAARGWHVFPLKPRGKYPLIPRTAGGTGYKDATVDAAQIAAWWTQCPSANVGIACGASDLYVVDCDHGLKSEEDFHAWRVRNNLPATYTVRTGRRTAHAVQMYFQGAVEYNGGWELDGCSGEIRSAGGLVMAVGNVHPDTAEVYQLLVDAPLAQRPAVFQSPKRPVVSAGDGIARPAAVERFIQRFSAYCERVGVAVTNVRTLPGGKVLIDTEPCLLHSDHAGAVGITADGVRCVQCFHARCSIGWAKWRRAVEMKFRVPMRLDGGVIIRDRFKRRR